MNGIQCKALTLDQLIGYTKHILAMNICLSPYWILYLTGALDKSRLAASVGGARNVPGVRCDHHEITGLYPEPFRCHGVGFTGLLICRVDASLKSRSNNGSRAETSSRVSFTSNTKCCVMTANPGQIYLFGRWPSEINLSQFSLPGFDEQLAVGSGYVGFTLLKARPHPGNLGVGCCQLIVW